jgi:hypothetical protein
MDQGTQTVDAPVSAIIAPAINALAAHEAAADPHPQYLTQTEGDARYPLAATASAVSVRVSVRNASGSPIAKGMPVYVSGSSGTTILVTAADASSEETAARTLGLAEASIANNSDGFVLAVGTLTGINTASLAEGQVVWLSENTGELTTTRPVQPAHGVVIGYCVKQGSGTSGILYVKIDNGLELSELHDVLLIGAAVDQALVLASDGLWKNRAIYGTAAPQALGAASVGTSSLLSRQDHRHAMPSAADVGADASGAASAAVGGHVAAADPHPQYLTAAEGNAAYATAAQGGLAATAVQPATLTAGLAGKADLVGGLVPTSQIPSVAVVEYLGQAANQAAMLALRGQGGDWCIRTDSSTEWVIVANNGATLSDWIQLPNGISPVSSINGQTGAVTLGTGDLAESGGNLFFTASRAISSALTGFVAGAGAVAATDSILQAINKIVGNIAAKTQVSSTAPAALAATAAAGTSTDAARIDHAHQRDTDVIVIPVGDESTALTAGTNKVRFRMPFPATLLAVRDSVNLAPTGSPLIVDVNEEGTSVLGTKLSIDATEASSTTAASAATITDSSLADNAEISIDIDQVGSTVAGAGLKVYLFVRRA